MCFNVLTFEFCIERLLKNATFHYNKKVEESKTRRETQTKTKCLVGWANNHVRMIVF